MIDELKKLLKETKRHDQIKKILDDEYYKECEISIKRNKDRSANVHLEGSALSLLITLTGLEEAVLNRVNADEKTFKLLKAITKVQEVRD